jgi:hypothetical protein
MKIQVKEKQQMCMFWKMATCWALALTLISIVIVTNLYADENTVQSGGKNPTADKPRSWVCMPKSDVPAGAAALCKSK